MNERVHTNYFSLPVRTVLCGVVALALLDRWPGAPRIAATATQASSTMKSTQDDPAAVPIASDIGNLPLRDALVVWFPKDWTGPGPQPWGAAYTPQMFRGVPITHAWRDKLLDIQADPQLEYVCWWLQFREQKPDWSAYREGSLSLRVRFSDQMYRRFKVELKAGDKVTIWIVDLTDEEVQRMRTRGFGDILLPLSDADGDEALKGLTELVLVFEGTRVVTVSARQTKGELKLHSIRLVPSPGPVLEPRAQIDELATRAFEWFETYRNPQTGLVPDRAPNRRYAGLIERRRLVCSLASVGYYLSILPDAVATGRLSETEARERALTILRFLETKAEHRNGLLYHFMDMATGKPLTDTEVSALDSAIFFNGCMVVSVHFGGEVAQVADRLIARADWNAFRLPAAGDRPELLSLGWKRGTGLLGPMDVRSTEFAMPYFLAIGAEQKSVDPQLWWNTKVRTGTVASHRILNPTHGLFTSYFGLGWLALQGREDRDRVNLWQNAVDAALANRDFCRAERGQTYAAKWGGWWGISAGDSPSGYVAPGTTKGDAGGTVWPIAALAALPWAENLLEEDLKGWQNSPAWEYVDGAFGLAPFNLDARWFAEDLVGIDLGSLYLAVANQRRGTVWNLWKQHPVARRAMERLYPSSKN